MSRSHSPSCSAIALPRGISPRRGRARTQGSENSACPPLAGPHVPLPAVISAARPPPHAPPSHTQLPSLPGLSTTRSRVTLKRYVGHPGSGGAERNPRVRGSQLETEASSAPHPHPLGLRVGGCAGRARCCADQREILATSLPGPRCPCKMEVIVTGPAGLGQTHRQGPVLPSAKSREENTWEPAPFQRAPWALLTSRVQSPRNRPAGPRVPGPLVPVPLESITKGHWVEGPRSHLCEN